MCIRDRFYFDGSIVCGTFLNKAFRFSRDVQRSVRVITTSSNSDSSISEGKLHSSSSNFVASAPCKEAIMSFLIRVADASGDKMPNCNERHLPFQKKDEMYNTFLEKFSRSNKNPGIKAPSKNYFYHVWKHNCKDVKVRKSTRFSKCDICEQIRSEMHILVTSFQSTADLLLRKRAHYDFIAQERMEYKRKRDIAVFNPNEAWSVIIDGADQTAFGLPHFHTNIKSQRGHTMKVKLVGLLEQNVGNKLRLLTMIEDHKT